MPSIHRKYLILFLFLFSSKFPFLYTSFFPSGLPHVEPCRSPGRPYTPPHSVYTAALIFLSTGEMSSDSAFGHTSGRSGSLSPNLYSGPRSVRYNAINVAVVTHLGRERKHHSSKHGDFSDNDDDFTPASGVPPASNEV